MKLVAAHGLLSAFSPQTSLYLQSLDFPPSSLHNVLCMRALLSASVFHVDTKLSLMSLYKYLLSQTFSEIRFRFA